MRRALLLSIFFAFACDRPGPTPPFIKVSMTEPAGFTAPEADRLEFVTTSVVNGNLLTRTFEADISGNPLPSDFVILFSEGIRGQAIDITLTGFLDDVDVYSAKASAIADVSEVEVVVSFCGDNSTSADRQEGCDDGPNNDDATPNACRTDCQLPACGDGVFDSDTEQCDDGNLINADGCEADCSLPACGNGIFELEDFNDATQGGPAGGCFQTNGQSFTFPDTPSEVLVVDFNRDGHLDLVSGFFDSELIAIVLGNGDGTFQPEVLVPVSSGSFSIEVANLSDSDNFPDFIISDSPISQLNTARISTLLNTDGAIATLASFVVDDTCAGGGCFISDISAGSFDADSVDEFAFTLSDRNVFVAESGSQAFGLAAQADPTTNRLSLNVKDVNLDGDDDLVIGDVLDTGVNRVSVALGNGDRTFQQPRSVDFFSNLFALGDNDALDFVDFNGDGLDDIVVCSNSDPALFVIEMNLNVALALGPQVTLGLPCSYLKSKPLGPDQDSDLILSLSQAGVFGSNGFRVLLSEESFSTEHSFSALGTLSVTTSVNAGDFNEDGVADIVVGGVAGNTKKIEVLLFNE